MSADPIRFVKLDKSGVAITTVRESEQRARLEAFAASNALYNRGYQDGVKVNERDRRIADHLKARFGELYDLIAQRVDAGTDRTIAAMEDL